MPRLNSTNNAESILTTSISPTSTTLLVSDSTLYPEPPFRITIDAEIMEVIQIDRTTHRFSQIQRGLEGTAAADHAAGATVQNRFTAGTYNELVSNDEMSAEISRVETAYTTADNSLSSRISSNDTDISNLQAKDNSLQSQINSIDTNYKAADSSLSSRISSNDTDISNLQTRMNTAEDDIDDGQADISSLSTRMGAVESKNTSQDTSITNLSTRMGSVESKNSTQDNSISSLTTRMNTVESKNGNQDTSISDLTTRMSATESKNTSQDTTISGIRTDLDSHRNSRSNPHNVTASQIGAYTKTESDSRYPSQTEFDSLESTVSQNTQDIANLGSQVGQDDVEVKVGRSVAGDYRAYTDYGLIFKAKKNFNIKSVVIPAEASGVIEVGLAKWNGSGKQVTTIKSQKFTMSVGTTYYYTLNWFIPADGQQYFLYQIGWNSAVNLMREAGTNVSSYSTDIIEFINGGRANGDDLANWYWFYDWKLEISNNDLIREVGQEVTDLAGIRVDGRESFFTAKRTNQGLTNFAWTEVKWDADEIENGVLGYINRFKFMSAGYYLINLSISLSDITMTGESYLVVDFVPVTGNRVRLAGSHYSSNGNFVVNASYLHHAKGEEQASIEVYCSDNASIVGIAGEDRTWMRIVKL